MALAMLTDFDGNTIAINTDRLLYVQQGDGEPRTKYCTLFFEGEKSVRVSGLLEDVVDDIDEAMQGTIGRQITTHRTETLTPSSTSEVTDAMDVRAVDQAKVGVACSDYDGATIELQWSIDGSTWAAFTTAVEWAADATRDVDLSQVRWVRAKTKTAGTAPTQATVTVYGDMF